MNDEFPIVIYHNPACATSRNCLAMIQAAGYQPTVIPYLETGWSRDQLDLLLTEAAMTPRAFLREKGTPAQALGLLDPGISDDAIIDAMLKEPILVNRPIVVTYKGVSLCRPSELVLELLENKPASFIKEDGQTVTI